MNVTLIGMPASGKSTIGVLLAKSLGYHFVDTDLLIQRKERRLLSEIIAAEGIEGFNRIENAVNASVEAEDSVIAPGGSVVYGREAMAHLKSIGKVVYLQLPYAEIERRIGDLHKRGVVVRAGQTLSDLYRERVPLYESYADFTVFCEGKSIQDILTEIQGYLRENSEK